MTGFVLRIIAMTTMLIDHIGWNFIDNPMILTWIWRIAFPCYAFLLAEGFFFVFNEKRRLLKHISTLILLAVISEPCFDLLEFGPNVLTNFMESQSVMITLLLWFLWMSITELLLPSSSEHKDKLSWSSIKEFLFSSKREINDEWEKINWNWKTILVLVCAYLLIGFTNYTMSANFNFVGPLLVIAFYWFLRASRDPKTNKNMWSWFKRFAILLLIFVIYIPIYFWAKTKFCDFDTWVDTLYKYIPWIIGHAFAALVLSLYNGQLGYHKGWFKRLYISFYPLHACFIGIIRVITGS